MGIFDLNNPLMRGMSKVADLIILNLLFMLCCIPIITIGPALSAMYCVAMKLVRNEEGGIVKDFFKSFRLNFRQGVILHVLFLSTGLLLAADGWFALYSVENHGAMNYILFACVAFLGIALILSVIYAYPLLAKFENTVWKTIRWSLILAIRHWQNTIALVLITAFPVWILTVPHEGVIGFLFFFFIIGFSATALAQSFFLRKVFDNYIPKADGEVQETEDGAFKK